MIAFPGILAGIADRNEMKRPTDPDSWVEEKDNFPHFFVFCMIQLGASIPYPGAVSDNCKIINSLSEKEVMEVSMNDLFNMGVNVQNSQMYA